MASIVYATQRRYLPSSDDINLEADKRDNQHFRKLSIKIKHLDGHSGSAYVELGNTKVICTVDGPVEVNIDSPEGKLKVNIGGSNSTFRYAIEAALSAVVCMKKLARTELTVEIGIVADDGGSLATCLLCAGLAIASANIEMFDTLLSCQVAVNTETSQFYLDPDSTQIQALAGNCATLTIAILPSIRQIVCYEMNGLIKKDLLKKMNVYSFDRCLQLYPAISKFLREYVHDQGKSNEML